MANVLMNCRGEEMDSRQPLMTRWGRELDPKQVLQEYPRPQMRRKSYVNLNSCWDYSFSKSADLPEPDAAYTGITGQKPSWLWR